MIFLHKFVAGYTFFFFFLSLGWADRKSATQFFLLFCVFPYSFFTPQWPMYAKILGKKKVQSFYNLFCLIAVFYITLFSRLRFLACSPNTLNLHTFWRYSFAGEQSPCLRQTLPSRAIWSAQGDRVLLRARSCMTL